MRTCRILIIFFICAIGVNSQENQFNKKLHKSQFFISSKKSISDLESDFKNLSTDSRPYTYWFWMNGNITKEGITKDLEAMQRIGVGGVFNLEGGTGIPKGPITYLSEEWSELKSHAISEAARLNIDFIMHNCPGWSSSGGPWITPELSMQKLTWSEIYVDGPTSLDTILSQPPTNLDYYQDIAVIAYPSFKNSKPVGFANWEQLNNSIFNHTGRIKISHFDSLQIISLKEIVDLTDKLDHQGRLKWDMPAGSWTIIRIGHTSTGQLNQAAPDTGVGLECDKFSKAAIRLHFNKMMGILYPLIKSHIGKVDIGLEIDSWEVGMQNWTNGFEKEFVKQAGYDLIRFLPAMTGKIVENKQITEQFLWDVRRIQANLIADNYYGEFRTLCNNYGLLSYCEPYDRGPMEEMQIGARVDGVLGEFWNGLSAIFQNNLMMRRTSKLASSIAHINGMKYVGAEAYTSEPESGRWQEHPFSLKAVGDKAFTEGINRMTIHRYAMQPHPTASPAMTLGPWGIHFDRTNTLWEPSRAWMEYLNRCQTLLQNSLFVADIAYFTGENVVGYTKALRHDLNPIPPEGYDYDLINAEILQNKVRVENGKMLLPDGMNYKLLVLQDSSYLTLNTLKKIHSMVQDGLFLMGERPVQMLGLMDYFNDGESEFERICNELWGNKNDNSSVRNFGKGKIYKNISLDRVLEKMDLPPDFKLVGNNVNAPIRYIHRQINENEIYFVSNQRRTQEEIVCKFRTSNKVPELWDPVTGKISRLALYHQDGECIIVPLQLEPYGSAFIVFRSEFDETNALKSIHKDDKVLVDLNPSFLNQKVDTTLSHITDNFSISFWVKPESDIMLNTDNPMGYIRNPWTEYYAIYPPSGQRLFGDKHATIGIAIGRNGIAIWENEKGFPEFKFAVEKPISGWTHFCVVYENAIPTIYLNGEVAGSGVRSNLTIHPVLNQLSLEHTSSFYNGDMTYPKLHEKALSKSEILQIMKNGRQSEMKNRAIDLMFPMDAKTLLVWENGSYKLTTSDDHIIDIQVRTIDRPIKIDGPWEINFPSGFGAPKRAKIPKLESLHKHKENGIKYFSGTATYSKNIYLTTAMLESGNNIFLDLGELEVMAEIFINGINKGILWTRPYQMDITDVLKYGKNKLEIRVTNLWVNRLIGDEQLPEEHKYVPGGGMNGIVAMRNGAILELPDWYQTKRDKPKNGRVTFATWQHFQRDSPLVESGLIGPVYLKFAKKVNVSY